MKYVQHTTIHHDRRHSSNIVNPKVHGALIEQAATPGKETTPWITPLKKHLQRK